MERLFPPWLSLDSMFGSARNALEIGCGSGKALLELAFRFGPTTQFVGTNRENHELPQLDSRPESLVEAALHFGAPVLCIDSVPVLPTVLLTNDFETPGFDQPLRGQTFDAIVSQYSLNNGRAQPEATHTAVPALLRLLAPGGLALVHLTSSVEHLLPERLAGQLAVLVARTYIYQGGLASLALISEADSGGDDSAVVLVIRRCPAGFTLPEAEPVPSAPPTPADAALAASRTAPPPGCLLPPDAAASVDAGLWAAFVGRLKEFTPGSHSFEEAWTQLALLDLAEGVQAWDASGVVEGPPPATTTVAVAKVPAAPRLPERPQASAALAPQYQRAGTSRKLVGGHRLVRRRANGEGQQEQAGAAPNR